jgi:hypothetical protein
LAAVSERNGRQLDDMKNVRALRRMMLFVAAACLIFLAGRPMIVVGQEVAIGSATARVLANIIVTAVNPLDFGDIFQGVPKRVANNEGGAAIFSITGQAGAGVSLYMQLPEYLSLSDGSDRMVIIFGATDASIDTTGAANPEGMNGSLGWQNVNPNNLPSAAVIGTSGTNIYLGGSVRPSTNQRAGNYSGDIVITAAYDGT